MGLPRWFSDKESICNSGDAGLIPGLGRSPGEGNHNPLQHSCLGNPMDREAWQDTVHRVTKVSDVTEQLNNMNGMQVAYGHAENNFCVRSHKLA